MAFNLRDNEEIKEEVHFHWSAFIIAKVWAGLGTLVLILSAAGHMMNDTQNKESAASSLVFAAFLFWGPFLVKWLQNKSKKYIVTNQRVYIEEGVLAKSKVDLPLNKINDVTTKQSFLQRMLGSGSVEILTGNDKSTLIKDIDDPDKFKDSISALAA